MVGLERQQAASNAQCLYRRDASGGKFGPGVGRKARHRRGLGFCSRVHLLGCGRDGTVYPGRLFAQHSQHMGEKPLGNKGTKPHATAHARPTAQIAMARQRGFSLGRRA